MQGEIGVETVVTELTLSLSQGPVRGTISRGKSSFGFDGVIATPFLLEMSDVNQIFFHFTNE
jgi:hypothetical protein